MNKYFIRVLKYGFFAILMFTVSLRVPLNVNEVKADSLELSSWVFYQTGTTTSAWNKGEKCAFSSVVGMNGETLTEEDFPIETWDEESQSYVATEITNTLSGITDGFDAEILSNGWSVDTGHGSFTSINPYTVTAHMERIQVEKNHSYTVSFTAYATSKKYIYVEIRNMKSGQSNYLETVAYKIIAVNTTPETYSLTINSTADAYIRVRFMMGAFNATYDYAGNDISDIINPVETNWSGTVSIRDFAVEDITDIQNTEEPSEPVQETTTAEGGKTTAENSATTVSNVTAPKKAVIKKITTKKKSAKKLTLKVKKSVGAAGYEVAVYKTKKNAKNNKKAIIKKIVTKRKITIKSKKIKNKTKLFVRVRAYKLDADGNKVYGKWSKNKKVVIK